MEVGIIMHIESYNSDMHKITDAVMLIMQIELPPPLLMSMKLLGVTVVYAMTLYIRPL